MVESPKPYTVADAENLLRKTFVFARDVTVKDAIRIYRSVMLTDCLLDKTSSIQDGDSSISLYDLVIRLVPEDEKQKIIDEIMGARGFFSGALKKPPVCSKPPPPAQSARREPADGQKDDEKERWWRRIIKKFF